jgi:hypothetical protein
MLLRDYFLEPLLLVEVFRPAELAVLPEAFFMPVLPLCCAAFFAVTGTLLRPLVVLADFRLLTFSLAILIFLTFFLCNVVLQLHNITNPYAG